MSPKSLAKTVLVAGLSLFQTHSLLAGPRVAGGEVNLQATASITQTDRVAPRAGSSSDTIYGLTPAITFTRESNTMDMQANLSLAMNRYDSESRLDANSLSFDFGGEVPFGANPRLTGSWNFNYFDGVRSSYLTNQNLDSKNTSIGAFANYVIRNKVSFRARASYSDYDSSGIDSNFINANETTLWAAGFHARDLIRGRIGTYVEYQVRKRKTNESLDPINVDATDEGLNFGITGQILPERLFPKLDADLSFGYASTSGSDRFNSGSNSDRSDRLTLDGSLSYPANTKTNVALTYNRSLAVTDDDRTVESSRVNLSVDYTPRQRLAFIGSVGFESNDFIYDIDSRNDDVFLASLGARYSIRQNWSAALNAQHRDTSSNLELSDYQSTYYSLSSTISF